MYGCVCVCMRVYACVRLRSVHQSPALRGPCEVQDVMVLSRNDQKSNQNHCSSTATSGHEPHQSRPSTESGEAPSRTPPEKAKRAAVCCDQTQAFWFNTGVEILPDIIFELHTLIWLKCTNKQRFFNTPALRQNKHLIIAGSA